MFTDLVAKLSLESLNLTVLLWSGVTMLLTGLGLYRLYEYTKAQQAEYEAEQVRERTDAERELEEAGISTVPGFMIILPFLFAVGLAGAALFLISAIAFGVVLTRYAALGALFLIETHNPYVAILFVGLAVWLYGLRTRLPFVYGAIEVIVGISAIISVLPTPTRNLTVYAELLSVSGGMYVIVRGFDNMNKAVPARLQKYWLILRWGVPLDKK